MDEESSEPCEVQESLQEVKAELARKRLRLLQEEVAKLKAQINSYKEDGEVVDLTKDEEDDTVKDPDYEKVVLYHHKPTGYYYDPATGQFYTLISHQSSQASQTGQAGQASQAGQTSQTGQASQDDQANQTGQASHTNQGVVGDSSDENQDKNSTQKLLDSIVEVSDKASQQSGFVYDAESGLYYDVQSGMYYDQENQLYYNSQFGAYFYYDSEEGQYKIHSLAEMSGTEDAVGLAAPPESQWDRCIRLMVKESHKLQPGCLYVVTKEGLQLGREVSDPRSIQIPELEVSKVHAEIIFDSDEDLFFITDLGSRNGTYINENVLSEPKEKSKPQPLSHGDQLRLGATTFVVHFHVGTETCEQCEPGLLQQSPMINCSEQIYSSSKRSIAGQRRNELQRLKKKYGLVKGNSAGGDHREGSYVDRAALRRATVGSDVLKDDGPDAAPSSVSRPIDSSNKGRQMLEKLGWTTGQGLGRSNTGIVEPVSNEVRDSRAGLGSSHSTRSLDESSSHSRVAKHQRLMKHFEQAEQHHYNKTHVS